MLLLHLLDGSMTMDRRCLWVEPMHKLEMVDGLQRLLVLDDDQLVLEDSLLQLQKRGLVDFVQINTLNCGTKLVTLS